MDRTTAPPGELHLDDEALDRLYRVAVDSSRNGHAVLDQRGHVLQASERLGRILGMAEGDLSGRCLDELVDEGDASPVPTPEELCDGPVVVDERLRCGDGSTVLVRLRFDAVGPDLVSLWVTDLESAGDDEREDLSQESVLHFAASIAELQFNSTRDPLTAVANRAAVLEELAVALDVGTCSVLLVDIDGFRVINEGLSHDHGDQVLRTVAARIEGSVRSGSTVGRLAGDEFLVLVPDVTDLEALTVVAERICHKVEELHLDGLLPHRTTVCVGGTVAPRGAGVEEVVREAQLALDRARSAGHGSCRVFDDEMRATTHLNDALNEELRLAVDTARIATWFQPLVDLHDGSCVGWEALARWILADGTARPAKDFIGLAVTDGPIADVGRVVVRDAAGLAASAPAGCSIAVNVAPRQLDRTFLAELDSSVESAGISHGQLAVELRQVALAALDLTQRAVLRELVARGVPLHLDHVGVAPATLDQVDQFAVAAVKLDRTIASSVAGGTDTAMLLDGVAALAHELRQRGVLAIAEGIEEVDQAVALRDAGWRHGQGYLFGAPSPAAAGVLPAPRTVEGLLP